MRRASFRSELTAITLDEGSNTSWIMALKKGTYQHPLFGEIVIDDQRAAHFAMNANAGVLGKDMDIDYDHKRRRDDAAGWVKATDARPDGVWYQVEWTDEAAAAIREKRYRYFSAEFADGWTHPETGVTYSDVLFGGGLTNRPFIKGMVPVNLSESEAVQARLAEEDPAPTGAGGATEGGAVNLTAIRTALKLSEGTSDEDTVKAVLAKLAESAPPTAPPPAEDLVKLAETNPAIARLLADREADRARLAEVEVALTLADVQRSLTDVDATTELAVTPAVKKLAEPLLVKLPRALREEVIGILRVFAEGTGTVKLGEAGGTDPARTAPEGPGTDPVKSFMELVTQFSDSGKVTTREATRRASQANPTLFEAYYAATTAEMKG